MATLSTSPVLRHLRRAVLLRDGAGASDAELLEFFLTRKDEGAFEAIVRRHGPMVLGVCRRILGNAHDADDAFQATFLVLVHKAATVTPRAQVGHWLFGVARTTALRARSASAKRRAREQAMAELPDVAGAPVDDTWEQLKPLLDEELHRLPLKYRLPIVLCDLQNKPIKETAIELGWPQGTLAGRLARARNLLAKRLGRHRAKLSGGALATVMSEHAASAQVARSLVSCTVQAAGRVAANHVTASATISANVAALTEGVLRMMLLQKLKMMVLPVLVLAAIGFGIAVYPGWTVAGEVPAGDPAKHLIKPGPMARKQLVKRFLVKLVLCEAQQSPLKPKILTSPALICSEGEVAVMILGGKLEEAVCEGFGGARVALPNGLDFQAKAESLDAEHVLLEIKARDNHIDKNDAGGNVVNGTFMEGCQKVELSKGTTFVLTRDANGKPQRWLEVTVHAVHD